MKKSMRGRPKLKEPRIYRMNFRVTKRERFKIRALAELYAEGDLASWLRYLVLEYRPKYMKRARKAAASK